jgi:hypothetical protein
VNLPDIKSLRDISVEDFNRLSQTLPATVEKRARHVVEEIERTRQAIPMLEQGRTHEFGQLMNACHVSLRDLYEVSVPELDTMVEIAQPLPGCFGARLTGGGFGGCTVNLVASAGGGLCPYARPGIRTPHRPAPRDLYLPGFAGGGVGVELIRLTYLCTEWYTNA